MLHSSWIHFQNCRYKNKQFSGTEYSSPKRMRVALPPLALLEGADGMDRWNPSPPWSDTTLKLPEYSQRFTYGHVVSMPTERAMVT